jgi:hypothetical protein
VAVIMTACATCGASPCINPPFCALCRDADARKARGEPPRCTPLRPPAPPRPDSPKANLESKSWKEIAAEAWDGPSWKQAALEYHHARGGRTLIVEIEPDHLKQLRRLMESGVSLDAAWNELKRLARERYNEAPKATFDAAIYELRTYGLPQLSNLNCQRRLADLSIAQIKNLMASLQRWRGQYPNVSDALLATLADIYDARIISDE